MAITPKILERFSTSCDEFLIHAVDVEGKCQGIEEELVEKLSAWTPLPATYAGGVRNLADLERIYSLGKGRLDATAGSALDIFGGDGMTYREAVAFHRNHQ